jgi:hypothetical protein
MKGLGSDHGVIEVLSQYLPGWIDEMQEKPQLVFRPVTRTEHCPNRVRSITATHLKVSFVF